MLNVCQESNLRVPPPPRDADTLWTQLVIARELCTFVCSFVPPTSGPQPSTPAPLGSVCLLQFGGLGGGAGSTRSTRSTCNRCCWQFKWKERRILCGAKLQLEFREYAGTGRVAWGIPPGAAVVSQLKVLPSPARPTSYRTNKNPGPEQISRGWVSGPG